MEKGDKNTDGQQLDVEVEEFELLIDNEIDRLFIPVADPVANDEPPVEPVPEEIKAEKPQPPSIPPIDKDIPPEEPKEQPAEESGIDLNAFETEIDCQIDSLFISAEPVSSGLDEPSFAASIGGQQGFSPARTTKTPAAVADPPSKKDLFDLEIEKDDSPFDEIPEPTKASRATTEETLELEIHVDEMPVEDQSSLEQYLDAFKVAYLSLDWEFSPENLSTLSSSLDSLEPFCQDAKGSQSLYKIMRALLFNFQLRPDLISPLLMEFLREAQELLRLYLQKKGDVPFEDRIRLKNLVVRVKSEKQKSPIKPLDAQEDLIEAPVAQAIPKEIESLPISSSAEPELSSADLVVLEQSFDGMGVQDEVESRRRRAETLLQGFEEESRRLRQIQVILERAPALGPLAVRVGKVESGLQEYIAELRQLSVDWSVSFDDFARGDASSIRQRPEKTPEPQEVPWANTQSAVVSPPPVISDEAADIRQEQVFLFSMAGNRFALPAQSLVKVNKLHPATMTKILSRGYATLDDFKPFFRSIKSGVLGNWAILPTETLKSYRFIPVPVDALNIPPGSEGAKAAMLISNGHQQGILLCDSAEVDFRHESTLIAGQNGDKAFLGRIEQESMPSINVLDVNFLLNNLQVSAG